jgi:hypothetical protein
MTQIRKTILVLLVSCLCLTIVQGQSTIPSTGGNANGSGGSVSYTVGQITYQTQSGSNGTVAQGVQQPYEISVVTAVENTEDINLVCTVYPNPTSGFLKLIVESLDYENLRFRLYNINGVLLQDKKVEARETEISLDNQSYSVYFLKVIKDNLEIKVFKIVKN